MSDDLLNYDELVDKALKSVIKEVLIQTSKTGIVGENHFYISFKTRFKGVELPDYLLEEYPEDITIVLQHQFFGLKVTDEFFEVMLTFKSAPERVVVPFDAVTDFVDPAARFRLQFEPPHMDEEAAKDMHKGDKDANDPKPDGDGTDGGHKVLSLDKFRKKKDD